MEERSVADEDHYSVFNIWQGPPLALLECGITLEEGSRFSVTEFSMRDTDESDHDDDSAEDEGESIISDTRAGVSELMLGRPGQQLLSLL